MVSVTTAPMTGLLLISLISAGFFAFVYEVHAAATHASRSYVGTSTGHSRWFSSAAGAVQEQSSELGDMDACELDAWGYALLPIVLVLVFRSVNAPLSHYQPQCT